MSDDLYVAGLGELLWDVFGETRRMGGAPANFACHAAQHGLRVLALSAIGDDASGRELAEALDEALGEAMFDNELQVHPFATGEVQVSVDGMGLPSYHFRPDVAWDHLTLTDSMLDKARRTRLVCFGTLAQRSAESRETIEAFLQAMPQGEGIWRVLDINLRGYYYSDAIIRRSLELANALKINDEEMEIVARREGLSGLPQLEQARQLMQRYGLRLLILTCGALGSHVLCASGECHYAPAPQLRVADSVGAGDAFTATFFAALLRGQDAAAAQRAAGAVAAYVCTQAGAVPPLPPELRLAGA